MARARSPNTPQVGEQALLPEPACRKLRIYAFDPSISSSFDLAEVGQVTVGVEWEPGLEPGPVGEYLEVVDRDPASDAFYRPVDLNDPRLLAQDGLAPSESNPQFHQQMVYAVAMSTIKQFEVALGRVAMWSSHALRDAQGQRIGNQFVKRLRIYPHALRTRNAFYSPNKKALLFGYFSAPQHASGSLPPGSVIFSCLSHDIVAHEMTHALLDGVHPRFNEPTNPDVLAFHESFADLVALFQKFSYPGVLQSLIARTRGNLQSDNLLGQLAQQFGQASGRGQSLRDAIGEIDPETKQWRPKQPDPLALKRELRPHARGSILVAAVFGAFLRVYRARTADLYRIATEGTGVLKAGDIHPDLARRLAEEAQKCAETFLRICIRAIDYCPPVGITFGDYLRAVITADRDLYPVDPQGFRLAFVDTFRAWGIYPENMKSLSADALVWPTGEDMLLDMMRAPDGPGRRSRTAAARRGKTAHLDLQTHQTELNTLFENDPEPSPPTKRFVRRMSFGWSLDSNRYDAWLNAERQARHLWKWLNDQGRNWVAAFGLVDDVGAPATIYRSRRSLSGTSQSSSAKPAIEIHSVRPVLRRSERGDTVRNLVVEITQRRRGYFDPDVQAGKDKSSWGSLHRDLALPDFIYRAGCTLIFDPVGNKVLRIIRTPGNIASDEMLGRMRKYLTEGREPANAFDTMDHMMHAREPFAMLHASAEEHDHG